MKKEGKKETGRKGEDEACRYLESIGHTILERNYRKHHTEIDIISLDPCGLHIVEVKSRTEPSPADPLDNINALKMRHVTDAALDYLHSARLPENCDEVFFDVVSVIFGKEGEVRTEYFPGAYTPTYF